MNLITATRRVQFCAGHRVLNHESKCAHLHGHNYVALFTASADLDEIGRVIDFSVLKKALGGWIDRHWDHGFVLFEKDAEAIGLLEAFDPGAGLGKFNVGGQKLFLLPTNPTAENLAAYLLKVVCPDRLEGTGVVVVKVRIWETENCYAEAEM